MSSTKNRKLAFLGLAFVVALWVVAFPDPALAQTLELEIKNAFGKIAQLVGWARILGYIGAVGAAVVLGLIALGGGRFNTKMLLMILGVLVLLSLAGFGVGFLVEDFGTSPAVLDQNNQDLLQGGGFRN